MTEARSRKIGVAISKNSTQSLILGRLILICGLRNPKTNLRQPNPTRNHKPDAADIALDGAELSYPGSSV
jgi:hypothetical protein